MPEYLYRAVHRKPDGTLGPTLHAQAVEAPTPDAAVALARGIDLDMDELGANAVYLTAPEDGRLIWSLHAAQVQPGLEEGRGDGEAPPPTTAAPLP